MARIDTPNASALKYDWFYSAEPGDEHVFARPPGSAPHRFRARIAAARHYAQGVGSQRFALHATDNGDIVARCLQPDEPMPRGRPPLDDEAKKSSMSRAERLREAVRKQRELAVLALGQNGFDLSAPATPEIEEVRMRSRFQLKDSAAKLVQEYAAQYPAWQTGDTGFYARSLPVSWYADIHPNPHAALLALERVAHGMLKMNDGTSVPVKAHWVPKLRFGKVHDTAVIAISTVPAGFDLRELV